MGLLRLATFNLLHGQALPPASPAPTATNGAPHPAGRGATDLLAESVRPLEADVLGIQEVDRHQPRSGGVDQTAVVAEAMGAHAWRFVATVRGLPGSRDGWQPAGDDETTDPTYGIALLSRFAVREWRVRRFAAAPVRLPLLAPSGGLMGVSDEPRAAIAAVVDTPTGALTVVTTHLSFVPGWNVRQLRAIARWVADLPAPRVLLGDVNLPGALPRIVSGWTELARVPTYPSHHPRVQFDHVLADQIPDGRVRRVQALPRPISDHCALLVDVDLDGRQP